MSEGMKLSILVLEDYVVEDEMNLFGKKVLLVDN